MIRSAINKLVNHKLKHKYTRVKKNQLEPTCTVCYRLSTPFDQYFLTLILLFLFQLINPRLSPKPATIID